MSALAGFSIAVSVLGWCLLHFVWQAAAIGVLYATARALLPRGNPRYLAAMLALAAMMAWPAVTAWHELTVFSSTANLAGVVVSGSTAGSSASAAAPAAGSVLLKAVLPWLVLAWATGVGVLGVRVVRQWHGLRRILAAAEGVPEWQARAREFADRLSLRRMVPVLASVRIATPAVVGWVRPAVVLPLALLAQLPTQQVKLILAHELAHLKRFDHIANLFQVAVETLFFYHPVVHWISREARNERELCCDALALRITGGESRDFVAALANLEEFRGTHAELALAASGGVLVERAWFIAGATPKRPRQHLRGHVIVMVAVAAAVGAGTLWWRDTAWQQRVTALAAANNTAALQETERNLLQSAALLPLVHGLANPLLPAPYARVSDEGAVAAVAPTTRIRVAPVDALPFKLNQIALRPAPLSAHISVPIPAPALAPSPVRSVSPVYPSEALLAGIQGTVVVEFALNTNGVPQDLEVVDSSAGQFDVAALQALARWRFTPPAVPGRRYRQTFTFRLGGKTSGDAAAGRNCLVTTGTHICRHAQEPAANIRMQGPSR